MRVLCPDCRQPFVVEESLQQATGSVTCPAGHNFAFNDGVLEFLDSDLAQRLADFLVPFTAVRGRDDERLLDPAVLPTAARRRPCKATTSGGCGATTWP